MKNDEFEDALSRHGGDLEKWPVATRAAAEVLVASDKRSTRMLADATRLDGLIAEAVRPAPVDAALIGRIIAGIGNGQHRDMTLRPTGRLMAWSGVAMATFLVIGFAIGVALPADPSDDALAGLVFGTSTSAIIAGVDDVL